MHRKLSITAFIKANAVAKLAAGLLGAADVTAVLTADIKSAGGVSCTYPDNSTPTCGKSCGYTCNVRPKWRSPAAVFSSRCGARSGLTEFSSPAGALLLFLYLRPATRPVPTLSATFFNIPNDICVPKMITTRSIR